MKTYLFYETKCMKIRQEHLSDRGSDKHGHNYVDICWDIFSSSVF